jgi:thiamine-phosphate pyrophosphorylase
MNSHVQVPQHGLAPAARGRIAGLYAITPEEPDAIALATKVRRALAGGARVLQYRAKILQEHSRPAQVARLLAECRAAGVTLIVNDDIELALRSGADGVHIGIDDGDVASARSRLGQSMLLGVSCYNGIDAALRAEGDGADYVAFGAMFDSPTKPAAIRASLELIRAARGRLKIPIVAIGGITAQNAASVVAAGADAVAVISAVFDAFDVEAAAAAFRPIFSSGR